MTMMSRTMLVAAVSVLVVVAAAPAPDPNAPMMNGNHDYGSGEDWGSKTGVVLIDDAFMYLEGLLKQIFGTVIDTVDTYTSMIYDPLNMILKAIVGIVGMIFGRVEGAVSGWSALANYVLNAIFPDGFPLEVGSGSGPMP